MPSAVPLLSPVLKATRFYKLKSVINAFRYLWAGNEQRSRCRRCRPIYPDLPRLPLARASGVLLWTAEVKDDSLVETAEVNATRYKRPLTGTRPR
jgi:hypothetical protein